MAVIDDFFEKLEEPNKSVFLFLIDFIKNYHPDIEIYYKWNLPYLYIHQKPLCYFWKDKTSQHPYIGFAKGNQIQHPKLIRGNRKLVSIYSINPDMDIDTKTISEILDKALTLYKKHEH